MLKQTCVTGYEGNQLCDYIVEEIETCPHCQGQGEVDKETCQSIASCSDCENCPDFLPCPACGGDGVIVIWR